MPREAIEDLYEQWNDVAEGFGVDKEESSEIFSVLQETLDMAKKPLASISDLLFDVYDTDNVSEARGSFAATPGGLQHATGGVSGAGGWARVSPASSLCTHSVREIVHRIVIVVAAFPVPWRRTS